MAMKLDNLSVFQVSREFEHKKRPEMKELEKPESNRTSQRSVQFQKHQSSERWMVRVVDAHSKEVIREIPDQQALDRAAHMRNMLGRMHDARC